METKVRVEMVKYLSWGGLYDRPKQTPTPMPRLTYGILTGLRSLKPKSGKKGLFGYFHQWFGRSMIVLGIINGGLGFRLTGIGTSIAPTKAVIGYSVVARVFGIAYYFTVLFFTMKRRSRKETTVLPRGCLGKTSLERRLSAILQWAACWTVAVCWAVAATKSLSTFHLHP